MTRPSSMSPKLGHGESNAMASTRGCSGLRGSRTSQSSCAESRSLASGLPSRSASHVASHVSSLASDRSSCVALQSGRSLSARGAQSARGSQSAQGSQTARGSGGSERDAWLSMSSGQSTSACRSDDSSMPPRTPRSDQHGNGGQAQRLGGEGGRSYKQLFREAAGARSWGAKDSAEPRGVAMLYGSLGGYNERMPAAGALRRAAAAVLGPASKRRAAAKKAARQVQTLLVQRERLEAQRVAEERKSARLGAARVAKEVAKFWRGCCRAAQYFEVQQRHAAKTKQHFENIQALVSRSEAFSSEVTTQLLAEQELEELDSSSEGSEKEKAEELAKTEAPALDVSAPFAASASSASLASFATAAVPASSAPPAPSAPSATADASASAASALAPPEAESGQACQRLKKELETLSPELSTDNFDRRHLSQQITTQVPVLLLRHQIREYQHVGLHWLATLHDKQFNGILADEMGLGKTIMTIALLAHLAIEKQVWGPHLIVVPTSVLMNWVKEFKKWAPGLKVCAYFGDVEERRLKRRGWGNEDAFHVCVVSYSVALQDVQTLRRKRWYYLILDEAQHIKNFRSQKWQQLMRFNSARRLLLTGTPLQNHLTELWSLLHFLMPDMFHSFTDFKEFFSDPLQQALQEKRVDQEQDLVARLHKVLRPFMLRRLKCEVERQLPNKHEYVVRCPLSRRQQFLYEEFMQRRETQHVLKKGEYMGMMGILMQLRKVCNHPELFEPRCPATAFVMAPLEVSFPGAVLLALWRAVAGRRVGEENFCSLLLPLLSLWRLEISLPKQQHKDLPIAEVIELHMPAAKRRRTVVPTLPADRLGPLRRGISLKSQKFLDESCLDFLRREEQRKDERRDVAVAVDTLVWLAARDRPWHGESGHDLLSMTCPWCCECLEGELCRRGCAAPLAICRQRLRLRPRPFLWPEPARCGVADLGPKPSPVEEQITPWERRLWNLPRRRRRDWEVDGGALEALCTSIHSDLLQHFSQRLGVWGLLVPRVQVAPGGLLLQGNAITEVDPHIRLRPSLAAGQSAVWSRLQQSEASLRQMLQGALVRNSVAEALHGRLLCHLPEKHYLESDCGKLRKLAVMLQEFKRRKAKCIIFTQFIKMLDVLEAFVCNHRFTYLRLDGMVKVEMRQDLVDRFNEEDRIFLFICSTRAGGVGINLTSANVVIFYDSDWNPAMDRQATDRAHRIGQTREVYIYRLISEHTVEENIWRRQLQKRELDNVVVDQGEFTTERLESLHRGSGKVDGQDAADAAPQPIWTSAEVRSLLQNPDAATGSAVPTGPAPAPEAAPAANGQSGPKSTAELEQILQSVEDRDDAQMARMASVELQQAEQLLKGDFHTKPSNANAKAPQKLEWLSLPRLVRWGIHRVRLLQVEEALLQRAAAGRSTKRKMPHVA
ncbi:unnamed protein product [Effrenium voratum]|uniref:Uncharacterized protein n=1 Tax=Effrenium voratum TaxID=2562239 RepID=A0AA36HJS2_9DINO|nr:unnamed protein product [Effrenium voratum]